MLTVSFSECDPIRDMGGKWEPGSRDSINSHCSTRRPPSAPPHRLKVRPPQKSGLSARGRALLFVPSIPCVSSTQVCSAIMVRPRR